MLDCLMLGVEMFVLCCKLLKKVVVYMLLVG